MSTPIDLAQLTVVELDDLMLRAAALRATLEPTHPLVAPKQAEAIVNPPWFTCLVEPGTLFQVRHPGFGWMSFVIPPNERAQLLCALLNQALFKPVEATTSVPPSVTGGSTMH